MNLKEQASKTDFSFLKNLQKQKVPKIKKVIKIPDMEEATSPTAGKIYTIKYFMYSAGPIPKIIRVTSQDPSFSKIHTIDICSIRGEPAYGFSLSDEMSAEEALNFVGDLASSTTYSTKVNESFDLNEQMTWSGIKAAAKDPENLPMLIYSGLLGIMLVTSLIMKYRYYFKKIYNWAYEKHVSGPLETKLNNSLFAGQTENEAPFRMYSTAAGYIKFVALGKAIALILCGPPGMSKTYLVRRTLHFAGLKPRKDYVIEKGASMTMADVYSMLYYHRKKIVILDDFDTPLQNPEMVNMLKAITDSYDRRVLSMPKEKKMSGDEQQGVSPAAPTKFEFKGKIIIVTNLRRNEINSALVSRAPTFEMNFNTKQILTSLEELLKYVGPSISMELKREVLDYISNLYEKDRTLVLDFRSFKSSVDARIGNPAMWKEMVKVIVNYKGK
jgi:hypothetical protein